MNKKNSGIKLILFLILIVALFAGTAALTAKSTRKKAAETAPAQTEETEEAEAPADAASGEPDKYSMQQYCADNAQAVFAALKSGDQKAFEKLMIDAEGADQVMDFADWSSADFDGAVSMGSGSLTAAPDEEGRWDESERFFVNADGTKFVFFIETLTSDYGRTNDGVSAVGVTSFDHFDATDYAWNGERDEQSALAGTLFWDK